MIPIAEPWAQVQKRRQEDQEDTLVGLILIGVVAAILATNTVWKDSKEKEFGVRT